MTRMLRRYIKSLEDKSYEALPVGAGFLARCFKEVVKEIEHLQNQINRLKEQPE